MLLQEQQSIAELQGWPLGCAVLLCHTEPIVAIAELRFTSNLSETPHFADHDLHCFHDSDVEQTQHMIIGFSVFVESPQKGHMIRVLLAADSASSPY